MPQSYLPGLRSKIKTKGKDPGYIWAHLPAEVLLVCGLLINVRAGLLLEHR